MPKDHGLIWRMMHFVGCACPLLGPVDFARKKKMISMVIDTAKALSCEVRSCDIRMHAEKRPTLL